MKRSKLQKPSSREIPNAKYELENSIRPWSLRLGAYLVLGSWCLGVLTPITLHAQQYSIDWFTIDGGGGTSTSGVYSVSGTIGQPDASVQPMAGGKYSLIGGFWSIIAVAVPGSPSLQIILTTTNTVIVSWPSPSTGFNLQQNADLNTANWLGAPQTVNDDGTNKFIIVSPPAGSRFYRLIKP